jgi:hypothetical protein
MSVLRPMIIALVLVAAVHATVHTQDTRRYIAPGSAADAGSRPFSGAVEVGKTLYLSGDIGRGAPAARPRAADAEGGRIHDGRPGVRDGVLL